MDGVMNERRVRTRKAHRCAYCEGEIPAGTPEVLYEWGVYDGAGFARYTCTSCEPNIGRFWDFVRGECEGDLAESFAYFMEGVAGEPYAPKVARDRDGEVLHVNCGHCWHPFPEDMSRLPAYCPSCQCEVERSAS